MSALKTQVLILQTAEPGLGMVAPASRGGLLRFYRAKNCRRDAGTEAPVAKPPSICGRARVPGIRARRRSAWCGRLRQKRRNSGRPQQGGPREAPEGQMTRRAEIVRSRAGL